MQLILARDRVRLRTPQALIEPSGGQPGDPGPADATAAKPPSPFDQARGNVVPAGVIGDVVNAPWQEGTALVRLRGPYPPIYVSVRDLEHAGLVALMPEAVQRVVRWLPGRIRAGVGIAATAVIAGGAGAVVTLAVQRLLGKC